MCKITNKIKMNIFNIPVNNLPPLDLRFPMSIFDIEKTDNEVEYIDNSRYSRSTCEYKNKDDNFDPFEHKSLFDINNIYANKSLAEIREALWIECSKYIADPYLEDIDAKLEKLYYNCEIDEERSSFDDNIIIIDEEVIIIDDNCDYSDELNHFNKFNGSSITLKNLESLKNYAKKYKISLNKANYYAQFCHNCEYQFDFDTELENGCLYCCEECEKNVEVYGNPCICSNEKCDICLDKDNVLIFNSRYNVTNFDEEKIKMTVEYAEREDLTISEAIEYLSECHKCGNKNLPYGDEYCNQRCCDAIEDFHYECCRSQSCKKSSSCWFSYWKDRDYNN